MLRRTFLLASITGFFSSAAAPLLSGDAIAQSALEKAFVSRSRLASPVWRKHNPNSVLEVDHSPWDAFLTKYVATDGSGVNRVAYGSVSANDRQTLQNYLASLQAVDVTSLNRNEQYAFWLNLYNAAMVDLILDNFPIRSVFDIKSGLLDVKGPFNDKVATVNGQSLTLDIIESGIVRPLWDDPRLHYAFNCAAVGCPNLGMRAYRGSRINAQLEEAAIAYVNNPRGVIVDNGRVTASKIYFWYEADFGGNEQAILQHIRRYAGDALKAKLASIQSIDTYEYDWALNAR